MISSGPLHVDPAIREATLPPGDYVALSVTDTGHGMAPEVREHIFEPFFTTKEVGEGTGLGLSSLYGIVQQSGGSIEVQSEPGGGSSFRLYFPAVARAVETDAEAEEAEPTGEISGQVLLVEDDDAVRSVALRTLREAHFQTLVACDGPEALRLAEACSRLHLLITGVVMPRMSGSELAERVRELHPGIRVLFVSGYTEDAVERHGVLESDRPLLPKPFTPRQLRERVWQLLK